MTPGLVRQHTTRALQRCCPLIELTDHRLDGVPTVEEDVLAMLLLYWCPPLKKKKGPPLKMLLLPKT